MMGRDHALLGGLGGLLIAAGAGATPGRVAAGAAVCAGFALLPDIDEPGSTVARKLGLVSALVAAVTRKVAGGHRQATHSALFVVAVWALFRWLERYPLTAPVTLYACLALTLTLVARTLRKWSAVALLAPVAAGWAAWRSVTGGWLTSPAEVAHLHPWGWLPWATAAGVALHLVGDALTAEGIPLFWPVGTRLAVPLLGHIDSFRERAVAAVMSFGLVALAWAEILRPLLGAGRA